MDFDKVEFPVNFLVLIMLRRILPSEGFPKDVLKSFLDIVPGHLTKLPSENGKILFKTMFPQLTDEIRLLETYSLEPKNNADHILSQVFSYAVRKIYALPIKDLDTEHSALWLDAIVENATKTFMKNPDKYIRIWYSQFILLASLKIQLEVAAISALGIILEQGEISESISAIQKPPEVSNVFEWYERKKEQEKARKEEAALKARNDEFEKHKLRKKIGSVLLEGNIIESENLLMTLYDVNRVDHTTWLKFATSRDLILLDILSDSRARNLAFCKALEIDLLNYDTWAHLSLHLKSLGLEKAARGAKDMAAGKPSIRRGDQKQLGKFLLEYGAEKAAFRVLGPS